MQSGEGQARKLNCQRVSRLSGTVLPGDFNTHSSRLDLRCCVQLNTAFWEVVIDENGLEIGNDSRATPCWTTEAYEGVSIIALTLPNRLITKWSILADDHATGSDREVKQRKVAPDRQVEVHHVRVVGWNLPAMTEKEMEAEEKLSMVVAMERAHLDTECTEDKVEQEAAWCQKAMSSILSTTA